MRYEFAATKVDGKWVVLCLKTKNVNFIGKGKRFCTKMAKTLNSYNERKKVVC